MSDKQALLQSIKDALADKTIERSDLQAILVEQHPPSELEPPVITAAPGLAPTESSAKKLSVTEVLFYLAGLILYAAIMVMAVQSGSTGLQIIITLGSGLLIWTATFLLGTRQAITDLNQGLVNALMLTGSLAVSSGGFFAAFQVVGGATGSSLTFAVAVTQFLLGVFHIIYDRLFRHIILIVLGAMLLVATFPTLIIALLQGTTVPADVWAVISISTGVLLAYAGRLASRTAPDRAHLQESFASFAAFIILGSIYAASFASSVAPFWEILLPFTIYAAFFVSIKRRSKQFLVTGSLFLVAFLMTISFKYFSGLGAAFSLILSAFSLLATAFVASNINKKYIKQVS